MDEREQLAQGEARALYRKITLRIVPYAFLCYIFNYLDRVNVGFAKLQMLDDLKWSESAYGLGAGVFFLGYVGCGVPANLMLQRFGARRWLASVMVAWGLLSSALMFVRSEQSFYLLRFFTGCAEAGFFPGMVFYLNRWFPANERGRVMALFMAAVPLSGVFGGPFSGWILERFNNGLHGLAAWQWLFLLQGVPTIALGIGLAFVLSDDPASAPWLDQCDKALLTSALEDDRRDAPIAAADSLSQIVRNPAIWMLGVVYFSIQGGVYAINFWLPSIIKSSGIANPATIGWLSALPYLAAAIFMQAVGRSADRRGERRLHLALPMLLGVLGLLITALCGTDPMLALVGLTLATMGALTGLPMFWPLAGRALSVTALAGGVALINSVGQLAGFLSPYLLGFMKDATGSTDLALYVLASLMFAGAVQVLRSPARSAA